MAKIAIAAATVFAVRKLAARKLPSEKPDPSAKWRDKVVLITGGSRGLGLALAFHLGSRGCRLALNARSQDELNEACRRLAEKSIEAAPFAADISHAAETKPLIEQVIQHFGRIDILINDAGLIQVAPLDSLTHEDFEDAMNLMFWAPVNLSLAVLPHMTERKSGDIVNIASIGGRVAVPHLLPYSCAKFACVGFSTGLAAEVKSRGIHVLTVAPGLMRTGSYLNANFGGQANKEFTWFGLLGNLPGLSIAAETAANEIVEALDKKQYMQTISLPAKILAASEALLPDTTRSMMGLIAGALPAGKGASGKKAGKDLSAVSNSMFQAFTKLGQQAARKLNE